MPKCIDCIYEGAYNIDIHELMSTVPQKLFMKCNALGGAVSNPISLMEAVTEEPCEYFQPRKKLKADTFFLLSIFFDNNYSHQVVYKGRATRGNFIYEIYHSPNKSTALDFLSQLSVTFQLFYVVVETPEGNWGLDCNGIYEENDLPPYTHMKKMTCHSKWESYRRLKELE